MVSHSLLGVYHRWEYFRAMALAYRLNSGIFTKHFLMHVPNQLREMLCLDLESLPPDTASFETCIWIDAHVDGVEFFENSTDKSVS